MQFTYLTDTSNLDVLVLSACVITDESSVQHIYQNYITVIYNIDNRYSISVHTISNYNKLSIKIKKDKLGIFLSHTCP